MRTERPRSFEAIACELSGIGTRSRIIVAVIMAVIGFSLAVNSSWKATPDSALYLSLGESLAQGNGYVFNGQPHSFVPPGYPALICISARLFGPSFLTYRILMAVMGLLAGAVGVLFLWRLCGRDIALLAGGLFAVNHVLLDNSTFTTSDVPFALFTLLSLTVALSADRSPVCLYRVLAAGLTVSVLPLIRVNGLGIAPAVAFFLFCSWKDLSWFKRLALVGVFFVVAYAPAILWEMWKTAAPATYGEGSYLTTIGGRPFIDQIVVVIRAVWEYVPETSYALTGIVLRTGVLELVVPLVTAWGMVVAWRGGDRLLVPLTLIQYCGLLLSSAGSRYLIFLIPGLYVFFALGILRLTEIIGSRLKSGKPPWLQGRRVLVCAFLIMAALNIGHNVKTIYGARTALERGGAESARYEAFFAASRWLKSHAPGSVVLSMRPRIIHYLSGCRTVALLRSGVPYHLARVTKVSEIRHLIEKTKPSFLFTDAKDQEFYQGVVGSIDRIGLTLDAIPEAGTSSRYRLWRIRGISPSARSRP